MGEPAEERWPAYRVGVLVRRESGDLLHGADSNVRVPAPRGIGGSTTRLAKSTPPSPADHDSPRANARQNATSKLFVGRTSSAAGVPRGVPTEGSIDRDDLVRHHLPVG